MKTYDPDVELDRGDARGAARPARRAARVLDDGPGREDHRGHVPEAARARRAGRHDRRRRQLELPRLAAPLRRGAQRRASTSSTRASPAGSGGSTVGYCLMVGGDEEPVQRLEPVFRGARARGRLRARRRVRRRPLHEDGPQRDRVRADAGLRRGLRGDDAAPSSTSTCTRSPASGATARSSARGCSSSCTRRSSSRAAELEKIARLRRGLRRGPLDDRRGDRARTCRCR